MALPELLKQIPDYAKPDREGEEGSPPIRKEGGEKAKASSFQFSLGIVSFLNRKWQDYQDGSFTQYSNTAAENA